MKTAATTSDDLQSRYLDLMKRCLTRSLFLDEEAWDLSWAWRRRLAGPITDALGPRGTRALSRLARPLLRPGDPGRGRARSTEGRPRAKGGIRLVRRGSDRDARESGRDWPQHAETMVGLTRLDNVRECVGDVLRNAVPGDLIETGVWRGGTAIFMRAALAAHGDTSRRVWVADSFRGVPEPDPARYPADAGLDFCLFPELVVSVEEVKANFSRYGLLDEQVQFLVGWFKDTLPTAPIDQLAVIRLDGDLYESTMDAITALYPKLSVGGHVIVDDYGSIEACRRAITQFRAANGITERIEPVDWTAVSWKRLR